SRIEERRSSRRGGRKRASKRGSNGAERAGLIARSPRSASSSPQGAHTAPARLRNGSTTRATGTRVAIGRGRAPSVLWRIVVLRRACSRVRSLSAMTAQARGIAVGALYAVGVGLGVQLGAEQD